MLAILPLIAYICLIIFLVNRFQTWDWRRVCIRGGIAVGVYTVVVTECLSLFNAITRMWLVFAWMLPIVVFVSLTIFFSKQGEELIWPSWKIPPSWTERILLLCLLIILALTGIVAWYAPPNTWDSLTTHMSRVAHWAQQKSIKHYATGIEFQNYYPPFPGMAILQNYILAEGDRFANFSQWTSMALSLVGVSLIAKNLGAKRSGQLLSSVFVASLPMGIAQSSSTMTDYIVAVLMVCIASEILFLMLGDGITSIIFLSFSVGLAILSKPIAFAYLFPFAILSVIILIMKYSWAKSFRWVLLTLLIISCLNAGYFLRNIDLFGNPMGAQERISIHSNEVHGWQVLVSNTLRNASLHAGSSFSRFNNWLYENIYKLHTKMGLELLDSRTTIHKLFKISSSSTNEVFTGNFIHAVLILLCVPVLIVQRKKVYRRIFLYFFITAMTFLLMSYLFKFSIFGSRYHTAFFVLSAPVVGTMLSISIPKQLHGLFGVLFVITSWPWLVSIETRPLIPNPTKTDWESVVVTPRERQYLGVDEEVDYYFEVARRIKEGECSKVFLMLTSSRPEYVLWVYLGAPSEAIQIEWNVSGTPSARLAIHGYKPCAVICDETCDESNKKIRGLPLVHKKKRIKLYLSHVE